MLKANMASNPNNPYEFFMSQPVKTTAQLNNGSNFKHRLLIALSGGVILVLVAVVALNLILSGGNKGAEAMYQVAATQQDIIELTELGSSNIRDQQLLNLSATINAVANSHSVETKSSISKSSFSKNSTVKIKALRDTKYKATLEEAKIKGTYDDTYKAILSNRLDLYRTQLQSAYASISGQKLKKQLEKEYSQTNELTPKE
jgi:hypothetical protein